MGKIILTIKDFYHRSVHFLTHDIWQLDFSNLSALRQRVIRHQKVLILTIRNFFELRVGRDAVAISFFTAMAVIPFVAVILFITGGLGMEEMLSQALHNAFPTSGQMIDYVLKAAGTIVDSLQNGAFGIISFLCFIWLVFWLMLSVEQSFNRIWKVEKSRKIWRRFLVDVIILSFSPLLLFLFCYGSFYFSSFTHTLQTRLGLFIFVTSWMYWLVFYALVVLILSASYKFIPHAKVKFGPCLKAAIVVGLFFIAVQYVYVETQVMVTRMGTVYGVFAAIPLLMVWLNICWQIILFGSELSYGFQKVYDYDLEKETWLQQIL